MKEHVIPEHKIDVEILVDVVKQLRTSAERAKKKVMTEPDTESMMMWDGYRIAMDEAAYRLEDVIRKASNYYAK